MLLNVKKTVGNRNWFLFHSIPRGLEISALGNGSHAKFTFPPEIKYVFLPAP